MFGNKFGVKSMLSKQWLKRGWTVDREDAGLCRSTLITFLTVLTLFYSLCSLKRPWFTMMVLKKDKISLCKAIYWTLSILLLPLFWTVSPNVLWSAEGMSCFPPTGAPGLWDIPGGLCKRIQLFPRETKPINSRGGHKFSHYLACSPEAEGSGWLCWGSWSRNCPPTCPGSARGWAVSWLHSWPGFAVMCLGFHIHEWPKHKVIIL